MLITDELDCGPSALEEDTTTAWLELEATLLEDTCTLLELLVQLQLLELLAALLELATLLELASLLELATEELDSSSGQADKDIPCAVVKQALSLPSSTML